MALIDKLNAIGDAIRAKTGKADKLALDQMPTEIASIETGGGDAPHNYATFKAIPQSVSAFSFENPLGSTPKVIAVKRATNYTGATRRIFYYLVGVESGCCQMKVKYSSSYVTYTGSYSITDGIIKLNQYNASNGWDTSAEYVVEIWQ